MCGLRSAGELCRRANSLHQARLFVVLDRLHRVDWDQETLVVKAYSEILDLSFHGSFVLFKCPWQ